jgi:hypothetical protein
MQVEKDEVEITMHLRLFHGRIRVSGLRRLNFGLQAL